MKKIALAHFKNIALLYSTVGYEPEPHLNFYLELEPHKNDAAPQH
jgi:hypothetical protein